MVRSMLEALEADGPYPDYADELSLFGRFVGAWAIDNTYFTESGPERHEAEWRFGWALDGRAVPGVLEGDRHDRPPVRARHRRLDGDLLQRDARERRRPARPPRRRRHRDRRREPSRRQPPLALRRDRGRFVPLARLRPPARRRRVAARAGDARSANR